MNVLITAASRRVSLTRLFRQALQPLGGKVVAVDYETYSPALFFADKNHKVPLVNDPSYISHILEICELENINLIIPTIDPELMLWSREKTKFEKEGIIVSISPEESIRIFTDKWNTFNAFSNRDIPFPDTFFPVKGKVPDTFPLFIKPRNGRGSIGAYPIRNPRDYLFFTEYVKEPILQTYLEGREFTVDALISRTGRLICCIPRYRLVIRSGVSDRGQTFINHELTALVEKIVTLFPFYGAINIQGKIHDGKITFFEINPRFSGGIQLSAAAGPNFAKLMLNELLGEALMPQLNNYTSGMLMTSYEDSLFISPTNQLINPPQFP
jgi:carbamoyl-phosphate synthase large subunit